MRRVLAALGALAMALGISLAAGAHAGAVVNGSDAIDNPGAVSLWTDNPYRNRCTGTLIDDGGAPGTKWVLTAAHCINTFSQPTVNYVEARIGAVDNTTGGSFETIRVVNMLQHEGFNPNTLANDIGLLELKTKTYAKAMRYDLSALGIGQTAQVNGYGWVCDGPAGQTCSSWYQGPLQRYNARVLPDSDCVTVVDVNQVCTESATGAFQSACLGDSGAPASTKVFNGYEWVHVVRVMVLGDGDDWNGVSCITTPDGDNGRSVGLDIAAYHGWIWEHVHADHLPATAPAPATAADHALVG